MVGLNGEGYHLPPFLSTLAFEQLPTPCRHWPHEHWLAAAWAPDEVLDDEMDAVFLSLVLLCLFHGLFSPTNKTNRQAVGRMAKAEERLTAAVETARLAAG